MFISPSYSPSFFFLFFFPHIHVFYYAFTPCSFFTGLQLCITSEFTIHYLFYACGIVVKFCCFATPTKSIAHLHVCISLTGHWWAGTSRTSLRLSSYHSMPLPFHTAFCVPTSQGLCSPTGSVISLRCITILLFTEQLFVNATDTKTMAVQYSEKHN